MAETRNTMAHGRRVRQLICELRDITVPMDAAPDKLRKIKELERSVFQFSGWMQMIEFRELVDLKVQWSGLTEHEGHRIKRKMREFFPTKRFASCNEMLEVGEDEEYFEDPTCRVLPAPED